MAGVPLSLAFLSAPLSSAACSALRFLLRIALNNAELTLALATKGADCGKGLGAAVLLGPAAKESAVLEPAGLMAIELVSLAAELALGLPRAALMLSWLCSKVASRCAALARAWAGAGAAAGAAAGAGALMGAGGADSISGALPAASSAAGSRIGLALLDFATLSMASAGAGAGVALALADALSSALFSGAATEVSARGWLLVTSAFAANGALAAGLAGSGGATMAELSAGATGKAALSD